VAIKTEMLRYFIEVAETGNLSRAARALGRTPSAVSMMLKQLEGNLGAPLFETDRKNRLTPLGEFTLQEARREIAHFEQSVNAMLRFAESGEGQVRLACLPAVSTALMPRVVQAMHMANPKVLIHIHDMLSESALADVQSQKVDIGITNEVVIAGLPGITTAPILSDHFGILCRRDSPMGRKQKLYWSDLSLETLIVNDLSYQIDEPAVRKAIAESRLQVESSLALKAFVRSGAGVSIVPGVVGRMLAGDLMFRVPEGRIYKRNAFLVWNEAHHQSPAVLRFCKILRETVQAIGMTPDGTAASQPK